MQKEKHKGKISLFFHRKDYFMIYVTGDTHGDLSRFGFWRTRKIKRGDTLIVLGDFGFLWQGGEAEEKILRRLGKKRYHILFLDGAHENYNLLERYPIGEWNGAKIRRISGNLCHLCRGQVIALEDKRLFVMGGGESDEKEFRAVQAKWFPQEMPTPEEIESARQSLKQAGGKVDFVLSHICSDRLKVFLGLAGESHPLGQFFTELEKSLSFQKWFFASLHLDKPIPPKHQCVYQQILPLL